jgi:hypothetical protein
MHDDVELQQPQFANASDTDISIDAKAAAELAMYPPVRCCGIQWLSHCFLSVAHCGCANVTGFEMRIDRLHPFSLICVWLHRVDASCSPICSCICRCPTVATVV